MTDDTRRDEPFKRLFFALDCPPAQRKAIAQWRSELGLRAGKPVPADNFHLTLLFLGAVPLAQINEVCEAAGKVSTPEETVEDFAGSFAGLASRRGVVTGARTGTAGVAALGLCAGTGDVAIRF